MQLRERSFHGLNMERSWLKWLVGCLLGLSFLASFALSAASDYEFKNELDERRFKKLLTELRCPTCENQNIGDSNSLSSKAMRDLTYQLIQEGRGDGEILDIMVDRYGDYVTYNPPVKPLTWFLWFTPVAILLLLLGYVFFIRKPKERKPLKSTQLTPEEQAKLDRILKEDKTL